MSRPSSVPALACVLAGLAAPLARAGAQAAPVQPPAAPAPGGTPLVVTASLRTRAEQWRWFVAPGDGQEYGYVGALARLGVSARGPRLGWTLEGATPVLLGLPNDAVAAAPGGQLGLGAAYYAANRRERTVAAAFLKQAFVRLGAAPGARGAAVRLGRFEFAEGAELAPRDPTLAALKRDRVAQRLLGPFGWTHVGRSFDGAHVTRVAPAASPAGRASEVTLAAALPTEGAFRASAWRPLDVGVAYGAVTVSGGAPTRGAGAADARLFALHYADWRPGVAPVDNRPPAARQADTRGVRVTTLGMHALWTHATPLGTADALAWGAAQAGAWGRLDHRAGAGALEAGLQPPVLGALRPWVRVAYFRGSGDGDATDGVHRTFFEVLPTPRPYARFPFHNLMNVEQRAAMLILRPSPRVTLRTDAQALRLASAADLWYAGGGAFEGATFGYAGRPSGGRRALATLADASADVRLTPHLGLNAYLARAAAGAVPRAVYPGTGPAWFGYLELDVRR